ncbi:MAG TPA: DUF1573 domain-containing protein [Tepidisphaeraceae bacterium]|nr:DUF1573 domain-containing protein [Tepidisphaeraceae bacterium]
MGNLPEGIQKHSFVDFSNGGGGQLILGDIKTTCGCTQAAVEHNELRTDEHSRLLFTVNTAGQDGKQSRSILVQSNDPALPLAELNVKYEVSRPLKSNVSLLNLGDVSRGNTSLGSFSVTTSGSVKVQAVSTDVIGLSLSLTKMREEARAGSWRVGTQATPDLAIGEIHGTVTVGADDNGQSLVLNVPVIGTVSGDLSVSPQRLLLTPPTGTTSWAGDIEVASRAGQNFKIDSIHTIGESISGAQVEVKNLDDRRAYSIHISGEFGNNQSSLNGILEIKTDRPDQKELRIPICVYAKPISGDSKNSQ